MLLDAPAPALAKVRVAHWIVASLVILAVDYLTGPFIQFPILLIVPVALATVTNGLPGGIALALALPAIRLSFFFRWELSSTWAMEAIDTAVDIAILTAFAVLIDRIVKQQREIRMLKGLLPICGHCKRIRDQGGTWRQLETYITQHSGARFSHTFCPECGRKHYPGLTD